MPWCDPCDRFYNPNTLLVDGSCPRCSTVLSADDDEGSHGHGSDHEASAKSTIPWHFWLVLGLVAIYLGWRVIEGFLWVIDAVT